MTFGGFRNYLNVALNMVQSVPNYVTFSVILNVL
jgi:hypothetical protein